VSDVYAMGGVPLFALNIACWNEDELPLDLLEDVLAGAADVAREGGWVLAGGHTIDDPQPKFGLAVVGLAHPDRLLRTGGLRDGDRLVLTKALGVGVVATAIKADAAPPEVVDAAVSSMVRPNAQAAEVARDAGATGATDVTGFGLLGHLRNALDASGVGAEIDPREVPLLPGAAELAEAGHVPGGTRRNLEWVHEALDPGTWDETTLLLLADAQTSGGLLIAVAEGRAPALIAALELHGAPVAAMVGRTRAGKAGHIAVR
jgi:selenide, water dikinase